MYHDELTALPPAVLRRMYVQTHRVALGWLHLWLLAEGDGYGPTMCGGELGRYMRFALMASDIREALEEVVRDCAYNAGYLAGGAEAERAWDERTGERDADRG